MLGFIPREPLGQIYVLPNGKRWTALGLCLRRIEQYILDMETRSGLPRQAHTYLITQGACPSGADGSPLVDRTKLSSSMNSL